MAGGRVTDGLARYALTEAEARELFVRDVVPKFTAGVTRQEQPRALILGGQPGAGKSTIAGQLIDERGLGDHVAASTDECRFSYPHIDEMMRADVREAIEVSDPVARQWGQDLLAHAIDQRYNVVYDSTLSRPDAAIELCNRLRAAGYETEVAYVAVPGATSQLGNAARYLDMIRSDEPPRLAFNHDQGYQGVLETADALDANRSADAIGVYRRGGERLYFNELDPQSGDWRSPAGARAAIEAERGRAWTAEQTQEFGQRLEALRNDPLADRLPASTVDDIRRSAEPVAYPGLLPTHEPASADPPAWRDRQHGALSDVQLSQALAAADRNAAVEAQRVADHARHVAAERERATDPAEREAVERRQAVPGRLAAEAAEREQAAAAALRDEQQLREAQAAEVANREAEERQAHQDEQQRQAEERARQQAANDRTAGAQRQAQEEAEPA